MRTRFLPLLVVLFSGQFHAAVASDTDDVRAVDLLGAQWSEDGVLLVGEIHGTQETERIVGELIANRAKNSDRPIVLGLEIPTGSQSSINKFLRGSGSAAETQRVLRDGFWKGRDGRTSRAMLDLISEVRRIRQRHPNVSLFCFDSDTANASTRDESMAISIAREHAANPTASWVIIAGNMHTRTSQSVPARGDAPMGSYLAELHPRSVVVTGARGTAWTCSPDCAVHSFDGHQSDEELPAMLEDTSVTAIGYDAKLRLKSLSASTPANASLK